MTTDLKNKLQYNAEKCASDVKKLRIVVNRISKVRQTTCNWIMKLLDEATRIVNVFLISWFFYLFLLWSISLLVKYHFILPYEAWVNAIRVSSFIENFRQISAKPIAFQRNLLGKLSWNRPFFTNCFSAKLASKIPAKSAVFSANLSLKIPRNLTFFLRPTRSPVKCLIFAFTFLTHSADNKQLMTGRWGWGEWGETKLTVSRRASR